MPTAILQFSLPEEESEFLLAVHGAKLSSLNHDAGERLRKIVKHMDMPPEVADALRQVIQDLQPDFTIE